MIRPGFLLLCSSLFRRLCNLCSVSFRRICNPTVSTIRIFNPLTSFFGLLTCALSGLQILNNTFRRIANHAETRGLNCKRRVIRSSGVCRIGANPVPEGGELCLTACVVTEGNGTCGKSKPPQPSPKGANNRQLFALFEDDVICSIYTASSASLCSVGFAIRQFLL